MAEKKYRIVNRNPVEVRGHKLYRIVALRDIVFPYRQRCGKLIRAGDVGGFVEHESNLSQEGASWIGGDAMVYGDARVLGSAIVMGHAVVRGSACVSGNAIVDQNALMYGKSYVTGRAFVGGSARVYGSSQIHDEAEVEGKARVYGSCLMSGSPRIFGNAKVFGDVCVTGRAELSDGAFVDSFKCYMTFKNSWSSGRHFTCYTDVENRLVWNAGCFTGTGEELVKKAYLDSKLSGDCYKAAVEMAESVMKLNGMYGPRRM